MKVNIEVDMFHEDVTVLESILEDNGEWSFLNDEQYDNLRIICAALREAIPVPISEPMDDFAVIETDAPADSIRSRPRYRFTRDNTRPECQWLCFENARFYEWRQLRGLNPKVVR